MKKHTGKIWRGLATTTASLLTITLGGSSIANARVDFINATLGTSSYKIEQGDSDSDGIYYESEFDNVEDLVKAKEQLAAEISSEGSVLFKNTDQTLPLDKSKEAVTLWGLNSHLPGTGGLIGSSVVADSEDGQIAYGIEEAMDERGFTVNETMKGFYASETCAPYYRKASFFGNEVPGHSLVPAFSASYNEADTYTVGEAPAELYTDDILESAKDTTAIVVLSRDSSEASDYSTNMKDPNGDSFDTPMSISAYEKEMIQLAKENSNGKVIVLINSDVPMEIQELKDDPEIGAILWTGLPGMNGFLGVCDVLSGDVNPSGHISDTYATSSVSAPAMTNFGLYTYTNASNAESGAELTEADKGDWYVVETEGIYIGYKYYETRYEDTVLGNGNADSIVGSSTGKAWNYNDEIAYPFGYGLSYTTFSQTLDGVEYDETTDTYNVKVTVTNTGDVAGKSVAEVYAQTPYGDYEKENNVEKSAVQVVGFDKTDILAPGASETLEIPVERYLLASYDYTNAKGYILSEGDYYFAIGDDAHDALNNILAAKGAKGMTDALGEKAEGNAEKAYSWNNAKLDTESYKMSRYSDMEVTNQFDDANLNNLGTDTVTYLSRSDWEGTYPAEQVSVTATEDMMKTLNGDLYTEPEDAPSVDDFTQGVDAGINFVAMKDVDYDDDATWDKFLDQLTVEEMASILPDQNGSVLVESIAMPSTYRGDDMDCLEQVTFKLTGKSGIVWPSTVVMTCTWNKDDVAKRSSMTANEAYFMGATEIWSGGPNCHRTQFNGRASAYYSEDGNMGYLVGTVVAENVQKYGIILGYKHMVVNDQEAHRESAATFTNEQALREQYLRAFEGAYTKGGAMGCMTAFNRIGCTYCGSSSALLTTVMRGEWAYKGHVTSDAVVNMDYKKHYTSNITAGLDYWCWDMAGFGASDDSSVVLSKDMVTEAIENGDGYMLQTLRNATKHNVYAQVHSILINGLDETSHVVHITPWWKTALKAATIGFGTITILFIVLYYLEMLVWSKKRGENA